MSCAPNVPASAVKPGAGDPNISYPAAPAENDTRLFPSSRPSTSTSNPTRKARSCVACRTRKVRCDKLSPCSNCRRANIPCASPIDKPRWARRLELATHDANDQGGNQVVEMLHDLTNLVKDLKGQIEKLQAANHNCPNVHSLEGSISSARQTASTDKGCSNSLLQDASHHNVWTKLHDELETFSITGEIASDGSNDEALTPTSAQELDRTASESHAFLFRHNLYPGLSEITSLRPLPSQVPFLLDIFSENVNMFIQVIHVPTITKKIRNFNRSRNQKSPAPSDEALMFAIYYSAIASLEEDEVMTNFSASKSELSVKYRLGLEYSLARANFLNAPNLTLLQALIIFLFLLRRHDCAKFVWMMTGVAIRMAQSLDLHRDGSNNLTPFEIEMRRRAWWAVYKLDGRASEEQGADAVTITHASFNTKLPLNINDADISPEMKDTPPERQGQTDMSFPLLSFEIISTMRQMVTQKDKAHSFEEQNQFLDQFYQMLEQKYLQHSNEQGDLASWVATTATRLIVAKMRLFIYLPVVFSSHGDFSDHLRTVPFIAAIEVAEYNHAIHSEQACRNWRWAFETYTHWNAIVYLLIEINRRPWSPIVERAMVALHSRWLIPQTKMDKNSRIWAPLRRLMAKAQKHRDKEVQRLQNDLAAAKELELEDRKIPSPSSDWLYADSDNAECYQEHWRKLVTAPKRHDEIQAPGEVLGVAGSRINAPEADMLELSSGSGHELDTFHTHAKQVDAIPDSLNIGQNAASDSNDFAGSTTDWSKPQTLANTLIEGFPEVDMDSTDMMMDLDMEVNWHDWLELAKDIEHSNEHYEQM